MLNYFKIVTLPLDRVKRLNISIIASIEPESKLNFTSIFIKSNIVDS